MVSLTAKWLLVLGMENTLHTSEAVGVSASFPYTCSLGLFAQIYPYAHADTHAQIAAHHVYLCCGGIGEQPTHVVLTLLDYGD